MLEQEHFAPLAALAAKHGGTLRVGLLTNQTGLDAQGRRTIDVLAGAPGLQLKLLFSPEHGINGALDKEGIQDSTPIMEAVEARLPTPSLHPEDAALAFLSALVEEFGDEWGNKLMFHHRWYDPVDQDAASLTAELEERDGRLHREAFTSGRAVPLRLVVEARRTVRSEWDNLVAAPSPDIATEVERRLAEIDHRIEQIQCAHAS